MNEYNHITATYFLLAERRLRAQRHDLARRLRLRALRRKQRADSTPGADAPAGSGAGVAILDEGAKGISQDDSDLRKGADRFVGSA